MRELFMQDGSNMKRSSLDVITGEITESQLSQEAIDKEWKRLKDIKTWDYENPMEYDDVAEMANKPGKTIHFGNFNSLQLFRNDTNQSRGLQNR